MNELFEHYPFLRVLSVTGRVLELNRVRFLFEPHARDAELSRHGRAIRKLGRMHESPGVA